MLLGAARLLTQIKDQIPGTVKLLFQPAEEGGAGGKAMIEGGALENPRVEKILGLHVWSDLPTGSIGSRSGPFMRETDEILNLRTTFTPVNSKLNRSGRV